MVAAEAECKEDAELLRTTLKDGVDEYVPSAKKDREDRGDVEGVALFVSETVFELDSEDVPHADRDIDIVDELDCEAEALGTLEGDELFDAVSVAVARVVPEEVVLADPDEDFETMTDVESLGDEETLTVGDCDCMNERDGVALTADVPEDEVVAETVLERLVTLVNEGETLTEGDADEEVTDVDDVVGDALFDEKGDEVDDKDGESVRLGLVDIDRDGVEVYVSEGDAVEVAHTETVLVTDIVETIETVDDEEAVELTDVDCVVEIVEEGVVDRVPD